MTKELIYPPKAPYKDVYVSDMEAYRQLQKEALANPETYWANRAEELLTWYKKWHTVMNCDMKTAHFEWFLGGELNASYNCLDRHVENGQGDKIALIWQGEQLNARKTFTYKELLQEVKNCAAMLQKHKVEKQDVVLIYMPMIPEALIAMLACARLGAIHVVVFSGFSANSLRDRLQDSGAKVIFTADGLFRNGRILSLKSNVDDALLQCEIMPHVIVVQHTHSEIDIFQNRDFWWHEEISSDANVPPEKMAAEDILFMLYTSGSTGKPKGVVHTTGGYLTFTAHTMNCVFDLRPEDIYWCTADIGWITGHTYLTYGPLLMGSTTVVFEGVPTWPEPNRYWKIIEAERATIFYTAPTVIRSLLRLGDEWPASCDLSSLRLLGSVGEPINSDAWMWYYKHIGNSRIPVVDTWWQTECGGIMISGMPYATPMKPGSASLPIPGIQVKLSKSFGETVEQNEDANLTITAPWPGIMRGLFKDSERFKSAYFSHFEGEYLSGDGAKQDEDGYYWILGRMDDVINVSGHRLGTAEIESVLAAHKAVAEAAVVGVPHAIKGEALYAYITLKSGFVGDEEMRTSLKKWVRTESGSISVPDTFQFTENLPKTRSGKTLRRILRKIATGDVGDLGDTSAIADPTTIITLIEERKELFPSK